MEIPKANINGFCSPFNTFKFLSSDGSVVATKKGSCAFDLTVNSDVVGVPNNALQSPTVTIALSGTKNSSIQANAKISTTAGNALVVDSGGLYVPPASGAVIAVGDTSSIDLTLSSGTLTGAVKLSATAGNQISVNSDGLYSGAYNNVDTLQLVTDRGSITTDSITTAGFLTPVGGSSETISINNSGVTLNPNGNVTIAPKGGSRVLSITTTTTNITSSAIGIGTDINSVASFKGRSTNFKHSAGTDSPDVGYSTLRFNGSIGSTPLITFQDDSGVVALTKFKSLSSDPTITDVPAGMYFLYKNTTSNNLLFWINDGGVMKFLPGPGGGGGLDHAGIFTGSGNGTTFTFTIAHSLGGTPVWYSVVPGTEDSMDFYVEVDATNISVKYPLAPPTGTNNIKLAWAVL